MCENSASQIVFELIMKEENNEERRKKLMAEIEKLFMNFPFGLDSKNREAFNPKFTQLKNNILEL